MKKLVLISISLLIMLNCFSQGTNWSWAKNAVTNGLGSSTNGVDCDNNGNSVVIGHYRSSTVTFGGITLTNAGNNNNIYVVKYDASGNVSWAKSAGGANDDFGNNVAVDVNGNIYITGSFSSNSIIFDSDTLTNNGVSDIFVVKYNPSGNVIWAKAFGGTGSDCGYGIAVDKHGNSYITGAFSSANASFGSFTLTNVGGSDVFIAKCDSNGNVLWADNAGGTVYSDVGSSISVDTCGNAYITGRYLSNPIMFGSISLINSGGLDNFFIAKYNAFGNIVWARSAGPNDGGQGNSIKADVSGNTFIAGNFGSSSITFGSITISNPGIFIAKYDSSGNAVWANSAGGQSWNATGNAICIDTQGNSFITGYFDNTTIVFGSTTLTNTNWSYDIYVAEYNLSGNPVWATSSGGTDSDISFGIASDNNQNIIIAGGFMSNNIIFGSTTLTNSSSGTFDAFIAKLSKISSIKSNTLNEPIRIFPNPFTYKTTVNFTEEQKNTKVKITDVLGKEVKLISFSGKQLTIFKGELSKGMYLMQIAGENENVVNSRIIIQ